jgi:sugar/nucleoside kinase (ribokinase family)
VVIHWTRFAVSASAGGGVMQPGPYCAAPKKSTGAGDRFNAGFCLGLAHHLDDANSLVLGCAVSGFFVRNARSATHQELVAFLRQWAAGTL